jgi:hypothetical protein
MTMTSWLSLTRTVARPSAPLAIVRQDWLLVGGFLW